ncbi:helix-turn-helix domain-containing protein [Chryseobacterium herbae]|uniref:Helix-turn-helix domain-containing protein n=1 Tax=Chryseobacterium herbae TaxID=2976476 RepID=A0ABT2ITU4_9FLAO|nr:helix-turn-helix domain-containing protein [Chryseobacterium sp. pc1-10]MCT2561760.1 helix-turn-helix domain-containing protein [Chryseobacterium sp. pc1-10]
MGNYTFEQLPAVLGRIEAKLDLIERVLLESNTPVFFRRDVLTIKEASVHLNLAVSTLYSKVSRKEIPVCKKGKKLYFSQNDLSEWIKSGKKKTNEEIGREASDISKKSIKKYF